MANQKKNQQVVSTGKLNRDFSYSKGDVHLNFTLRVDIKTQLRDFLEILKTAVIEVEEILTTK